MKNLKLALITTIAMLSVAFPLMALMPVDEKPEERYVRQDFTPAQSEINRKLEQEIVLMKSEIKVRNAEAK